jgi:hypothetical protein
MIQVIHWRLPSGNDTKGGGRHEIFVLDSGADRNVSHCGAFHGRYANNVTTISEDKGRG